MHYRLELVLIPVTDVDRAKAFYVDRAGFGLDLDVRRGESFRVVQMTPPGSDCSISVGVGITDAAPGSVRGLHLCVTDIEAAHRELTARDVEVSGIQHVGPEGWTDGPHPERGDFESFAGFSDPDGNTWVLQEKGYAAAKRAKSGAAVEAAAARGRRRPRKA